MFSAVYRPQLPAVQTVSVADVEKGINVIVRDDVALARLRVNGERDELDLVLEQTLLQGAVKRNERGVIQIRVCGTLLKIKREQRETPGGGFRLIMPPRETQQLEKMPAIFFSEAIVREQRIKKI